MRHIRLYLLSLIVVVLALGAVPGLCADDTQPAKESKILDGIRLIPNLEYANVNGKSLLLDLYLPESIDKPVPVIVYVHGGGWIGGDKHEILLDIGLVKHGYAIASINYRFSNEAVYPAQIYDCKAAVRWVRAHSKFYGLDIAHVGAWGASAGGHLAALLGTTAEVKELEGDEGNADQSSRVQAVCDWFGPTDFSKISEEYRQAGNPNGLDVNAADSLVSRLIGAPIQEAPEKTQKANPIAFVGHDSPPFLIMHGDKDPLVPLAQSELLRDALEKDDVEVKLEVVKGAGHGFLGADHFKRVADFFDAHLKVAKPGPTTAPSGK